MHLSKQRNLANNTRSINFQTAAVIPDLDPRYFGDQPIGNPRGNQPQDQTVFPFCTFTNQQIEIICSQIVDHSRNICRIILQITIKRCDQLATGCINSGLHGSGLPEVTIHRNHASRQ